jgi:hypothetical protein
LEDEEHDSSHDAEEEEDINGAVLRGRSNDWIPVVARLSKHSAKPPKFGFLRPDISKAARFLTGCII